MSPRQPWLQQRVRWRHVCAVFGLIVALWLGALMAGAAYVWQQHQLRIALHHTAAVLSLPHGLRASAQTTTPIQTRIDWMPTLIVPIDQPVRVALPDTLHTQARLDARVPIHTRVTFSGSVPVALDLALDVPVHRWLPTAHVRLPLSLNVPVHIDVPLDTDVPLHLDTRVAARLDAPLTLPLRTQLKVRVPLHHALEGHATQQTDFALHTPIDALGLTIDRADLSVPLRAVRLHKQPPAP